MCTFIMGDQSDEVALLFSNDIILYQHSGALRLGYIILNMQTT